MSSITTKTAGGKITGLLALTVEAQVALNEGDPVMVTGPYEVGLCDGSKACIGVVSVPNRKRNIGVIDPVAQVPGQCTVEALGFYVRKVLSGGAIAAGEKCGFGAAGAFLAAGEDVATCAVALMPATDDGQWIDVLFTGVG